MLKLCIKGTARNAPTQSKSLPFPHTLRQDHLLLPSSRHPQFSMTITNGIMYKTCNKQLTNISASMVTTAPVEIGTQGTVASLLLREIEHFRKLELERKGKGLKSQSQVSDIASAQHGSRPNGSRPKVGFVVITQKRKKYNRGSGFLPSMCSFVDVADANHQVKTSRLSYKNLKTEVNKQKG